MDKKTRNRWLSLIVCILACSNMFGAGAYNNRSFSMGMSVLMPYDLTNPAVDFTYNTARTISDLDYWHFDSGVPWPEAYDNLPYQTNFQDQIDFKVTKRNAGSKLYLAINCLDNYRTGLALYEGTSSNSARPGVWATKDFDDPMVLQAYLNYARYMINKFNPNYLNYAIEVNCLAKNNPASFEKFVPFIANVYKTLKQEFPTLVLFMSFNNNDSDTWPDVDVIKRLLPYSDLIGYSFYPFRDPATIKDSLIYDIRNLDPNKKIAIAEFGYTAEDFTFVSIPFYGSDESQRAFLEKILNIAQKERCEFVCWFLLRDYDALMPLFSGNPTLYEQLKVWEFTGLMDEDGRERPALIAWKSWLALPLNNAVPVKLDTILAYPNPFKVSTNSVVNLTNLPANAVLTVYSPAGEKLRELTATSLGIASWDIKDSSGNTVANGIYPILIQANGLKTFKKIAIIK